MRFLWCVVLATLAFSQDLKLDLSLEEDTNSSSSTQKQDDDFLNSLELELNQAAKESKPQEGDEESIEIPTPNNPDPKLNQPTPPKEPTQDPLMQQESPKQEAPQPQNNSTTPNTDPQNVAPQSVAPQEEGELIIPTDPSNQAPQEAQPSQESQTQPNVEPSQENTIEQDSNTTPQIQENQEQQIPQDSSQNIEQTPTPQSLEQSNTQTQEPIPQNQPIQQPQATQQAPQIQQTPQASLTPQPSGAQSNQAQPSQTPPTPQSQDSQAPLTSQPLQNTTPLPTKDEHLTYREKIKIISREELLKKSNQCDEKGEEKVCFDVGMIYYQGRSEKGQDLQEAYHYLEKSCKGKKGLGCYEAGIIRANSGVDLPYGAALLNRACELGDLRGCRNLAILYYNGQGVPKNIYQAFNLFKKGCEAGDQKSCLKFYLGLGNTYRDTQNYPKAKIMYEKACKLGEQAACNELYLLSRKAHPSTRYLFGNSQNKP